MKVGANLVVGFLTALVLVLSCSETTSAFKLFGGGGGAATANLTDSDIKINKTNVGNSSEPSGPLDRRVNLLVRSVDAEDPYFRSMSFAVPLELNYMMGEYLHARFANMLKRHCNITSNLTRLVRNNLQLLLSDVDVWHLQEGDRVEIWTNSSGPPTRAETLKAWAKPMRKMARPGMPPRRPPPPCPPGADCPPPRRGGRGNRGRGRPGRRNSGDQTIDLSEEMPVEAPGDEPVVVPDFSETDDFF